VNYGVSFPVCQKLKRPIVSDPLFAELIRQTKEAPAWNFHKYLVDRDGKVRAFESGVEPESKTLAQAIEVALKTEASKKY
jgi:glutathione peroxidase